MANKFLILAGIAGFFLFIIYLRMQKDEERAQRRPNDTEEN